MKVVQAVRLLPNGVVAEFQWQEFAPDGQPIGDSRVVPASDLIGLLGTEPELGTVLSIDGHRVPGPNVKGYSPAAGGLIVELHSNELGCTVKDLPPLR